MKQVIIHGKEFKVISTVSTNEWIIRHAKQTTLRLVQTGNEYSAFRLSDGARWFASSADNTVFVG